MDVERSDPDWDRRSLRFTAAVFLKAVRETVSFMALRERCGKHKLDQQKKAAGQNDSEE